MFKEKAHTQGKTNGSKDINTDATGGTALHGPPAHQAGNVAATPARRSSGRPTVAEGQLLTERILEVAQAQFLSTGYHDATLERIAAEIGVHKGALYVRYPDKFSIFAEVCARLVKRLYRVDKVILTDDLPMRDSLFKQAIALINAATHPTTIAFFEMIVRDVPRHPELSKTSVKIWKFYLLQISSYFQSRIDRGLMNLRDPVNAAEIFAGMILNRIHIWVVHGIDMPAQDELYQAVDNAVLVFLGGMGRLEIEGEINPAVNRPAHHKNLRGEIDDEAEQRGNNVR